MLIKQFYQKVGGGDNIDEVKDVLDLAVLLRGGEEYYKDLVDVIISASKYLGTKSQNIRNNFNAGVIKLCKEKLDSKLNDVSMAITILLNSRTQAENDIGLTTATGIIASMEGSFPHLDYKSKRRKAKTVKKVRAVEASFLDQLVKNIIVENGNVSGLDQQYLMRIYDILNRISPPKSDSEKFENYVMVFSGAIKAVSENENSEDFLRSCPDILLWPSGEKGKDLMDIYFEPKKEQYSSCIENIILKILPYTSDVQKYELMEEFVKNYFIEKIILKILPNTSDDEKYEKMREFVKKYFSSEAAFINFDDKNAKDLYLACQKLTGNAGNTSFSSKGAVIKFDYEVVNDLYLAYRKLTGNAGSNDDIKMFSRIVNAVKLKFGNVFRQEYAQSLLANAWFENILNEMTKLKESDYDEDAKKTAETSKTIIERGSQDEDSKAVEEQSKQGFDYMNWIYERFASALKSQELNSGEAVNEIAEGSVASSAVIEQSPQDYFEISQTCEMFADALKLPFNDRIISYAKLAFSYKGLEEASGNFKKWFLRNFKKESDKKKSLELLYSVKRLETDSLKVESLIKRALAMLPKKDRKTAYKILADLQANPIEEKLALAPEAIRQEIMDENKEPSSEEPSAIMTKNLPYVNALANDGKSALNIALRVSLKEFLTAFLNPADFIKGHTKKFGPVILVMAGIAAGILTCFLPGLVISWLLFFYAVLAAGAAELGVHILMDWIHFKISGLIDAVKFFGKAVLDKEGKVKVCPRAYINCVKVSSREELSSAVKKFGAAATDQYGRMYANIFLPDYYPEDADKLEPQTTGMMVEAEGEGRQVWATVKDGELVLFADKSRSDAVQNMLIEQITPKGGIKASNKAGSRLKKLFRKLNIEFDYINLAPGIKIDFSDSGKKIYYDEMGTMVVTSDLFEGINENNKKAVAVILGKLMAIRTAEKRALSSTIFINLDNINSITDLERNLYVLNKIGAGPVIIKPSVFSGLNEEDAKRISGLIRSIEDKVQIYVDLTKSEKNSIDYRALGLSGYVTKDKKGDTYIFDYYVPKGSKDSGRKAKIIEGYETPAELVREINKSEGCKILNLSDLIGIFLGDRSILERVGLTELLKTTILSLYKANKLSESFVREVGLAWEELPVIPRDKSKLIEALSNGSVEDVISELGIKGSSHSINIYLMKLANETKGTEEAAGLPKLQKAFLRAVIENSLVQEKIEELSKISGREGLILGFADPKLKNLLGQALLKGLELSSEGEGSSLTVEEFQKICNAGVINAPAFYLKLRVKADELINSPGSGAKDINAAIELISQLGEAKQENKFKENKDAINQHSFRSMMAAA